MYIARWHAKKNQSFAGVGSYISPIPNQNNSKIWVCSHAKVWSVTPETASPGQKKWGKSTSDQIHIILDIYIGQKWFSWMLMDHFDLWIVIPQTHHHFSLGTTSTGTVLSRSKARLHWTIVFYHASCSPTPIKLGRAVSAVRSSIDTATSGHKFWADGIAVFLVKFGWVKKSMAAPIWCCRS